MAFQPLPPTFELHTSREQQFFPRPITDTIESSLDLLERVEEDRRRRLRSIANVAARVPIGLGGTEDRGTAAGGGGVVGANVSPKPSNASSRPSNYGRYRYYPPPDETPMDESISIHRSYTQAVSSSNSPLVTGRSRDRRKHTTTTTTAAAAAMRRAAAARGVSVNTSTTSPSAASSSARNNRSTTTTTSRRDLHTPTDGIGTTTTIHVDNHDTSTDDSASSSIEGGRFLDSFNVSSSPVLFLSPPFDPRAGGGGGGRTPGRRRGSMGSSSSNMMMMRSPWHQQSSSTSIDWSMSTPHNNTQSNLRVSQQLRVDTSMATTSLADGTNNHAAMMMDDTDLITPPAMSSTTFDHASAQHGHGGGEDVYSRRRAATSVRRSQRQRRRRRDWE